MFPVSIYSSSDQGDLAISMGHAGRVDHPKSSR